MNRWGLGAGLLAMAALVGLTAPAAAAAFGPLHPGADALRHAARSHPTGEPKRAPRALRSQSGHVSPYARSRAGLVDPGDVESIRSYYQRGPGHAPPQDPAPDASPPGGAL